jgi:putative restriction endonuclease
MAFWWVFQGDSFQRSRAGQYLWAPQVTKTGKTLHHWSNMTRVSPGDVVFSGFNQRLVAVSTVARAAYDSAPPDPRDLVQWPGGSGWRVDVSYVDVDPPIPYPDFLPRLLPLLPDRHSPFGTTGRGNMGYLFEVRAPDLLERAVLAEPKNSPQETTKRALIDARKGQGSFRAELDAYWGHCCAVVSVRRRELLRASHIKPWSSSSHHERLDAFNGLLLSIAYDAAFDALLITFSQRLA